MCCLSCTCDGCRFRLRNSSFDCLEDSVYVIGARLIAADDLIVLVGHNDNRGCARYIQAFTECVVRTNFIRECSCRVDGEREWDLTIGGELACQGGVSEWLRWGRSSKDQTCLRCAPKPAVALTTLCSDGILRARVEFSSQVTFFSSMEGSA